MRYFVGLVLCFLCSIQNVHACWNTDSSLFFWAAPSTQPNADLVATVSVSEVSKLRMPVTATVTILKIEKTSDTRIREGDTVAMKFGGDSCGPRASSGAKGTIVARTGTDSEGRLVVYPYSMSHKGEIEPPFVRRFYPPPVVPKKDELPKLNAVCAAFYDGLLEARRKEGQSVPATSEKSNTHRRYLQRLNDTNGSKGPLYEIDFTSAKSELAKKPYQPFDQCWMVELHSSIAIKELEQKHND